MSAKADGDRYQVRGVSAGLQKRISDAARARGLSVSALVVAALEAHLRVLNEGVAIPKSQLARLEDVAGELQAVSETMSAAIANQANILAEVYRVLARGQAFARQLENAADAATGHARSKDG